MLCMPRGNANARIMVIGEAPGTEDAKQGHPFMGSSGRELDNLLSEAGVDLSDIYYTTVARSQPANNHMENFLPPSKKKAEDLGAIWYCGRYCTEEIIDGLTALKAEIQAVKPNIIVGLGNTPLWALTGEKGITKWRGTLCEGELDGVSFKFLPTIHPQAVLRQYTWRWIVIHDLKRVAREAPTPDLTRRERTLLIRPSYEETTSWLVERLRWAYCGVRFKLAVDLETRATHIACIGLADSKSHCICIPLMCVDDLSGYWSIEEETQIYLLVRALLTHPNVAVVGQNYLYDQQYFALRMGFKSNYDSDTMIKHQVVFPGTKKGLDFISSLYSDDYFYWKDEGKEWNPRLHNEDQLWHYNCLDACFTYEDDDELDKLIDAFDLRKQYAIQMQDAHHAFTLMLRGIKTDIKVKAQMGVDLGQAMVQRQDFLNQILGTPINIQSPLQINKLLYKILQLPEQKKKRHTTDGIKYTTTGGKDAIDDLMEMGNRVDALFHPLLLAIKEYRSLATYKKNFAEARVDRWDGRIRCSINVAGPETFRWSTSEDAFGTGMNLQNIPRNR